MNEIYELATDLRAALAPGWERCEIAGSLRRGSDMPKDIEMVCIPRIESTPVYDLFGGAEKTESVNVLEIVLAGLIDSGAWEYDPDLRRNGEKYKRLRHTSTRNYRGELVACDLFIVNTRTWGIQFAIRTGPGDFSRALVTRAQRLGMFVSEGLLHNHTRQYRRNPITDEDQPLPCPKGDACPLVIPTPEEPDFFAALGVEYLEPENRGVENLRMLRKVTNGR